MHFHHVLMVMMAMVLSLKIGLNHAKEIGFAFFEPLDKRFTRILGKVLALNYVVMQVVSKVLSTYVASMAVEDAEEANLWPVSFPVLVLRFENVQDYADSILVVLSYDALVSIGSICFNDTTFLIRSLRYFMVLQLECFGV